MTKPATENQKKLIKKFSLIERYMLKKMHPVSIFINTSGILWVFYFLWQHMVFPLILTFILTATISQLATFRLNVDQFSESRLGKLALLHLHPINAIIQSIGIIGLGYGLWLHSLEFILGGITTILLGHLKGWSEVDKRFYS